jgi:hypothetical protein
VRGREKPLVAVYHLTLQHQFRVRGTLSRQGSRKWKIASMATKHTCHMESILVEVKVEEDVGEVVKPKRGKEVEMKSEDSKFNTFPSEGNEEHKMPWGVVRVIRVGNPDLAWVVATTNEGFPLYATPGLCLQITEGDWSCKLLCVGRKLFKAWPIGQKQPVHRDFMTVSGAILSVMSEAQCRFSVLQNGVIRQSARKVFSEGVNKAQRLGPLLQRKEAVSPPRFISTTTTTRVEPEQADIVKLDEPVVFHQGVDFVAQGESEKMMAGRYGKKLLSRVFVSMEDKKVPVPLAVLPNSWGKVEILEFGDLRHQWALGHYSKRDMIATAGLRLHIIVANFSFYLLCVAERDFRSAVNHDDLEDPNAAPRHRFITNAITHIMPTSLRRRNPLLEGGVNLTITARIFTTALNYLTIGSPPPISSCGHAFKYFQEVTISARGRMLRAQAFENAGVSGADNVQVEVDEKELSNDSK